jgi:hypothetical protein
MIKELQSTIMRRGGLSRSNRFDIVIPLPLALQEVDGGKDLTLLCESTFIPGKQIITNDWAIYGHTIKIPYAFMQEDVTCVFNVTNDFYAKRIFDKWQNRVIDNKKFFLYYENEYKTDITIRQLDEQDKPVFMIKLFGAYPTTVQPIILDNNADQQTQKLSVGFAYNDFEQNPV